MLAQFQRVGRDLFTRGLVASHTGNLSIRLRNHIIITRRGCMLGDIQERDLIETGIEKNDRSTPLASTELAVHRAIYQMTSARAIIHAHPPYATALSLVKKEIVPKCAEGLATVGRVPVLGWNVEVKPGGLAVTIAEALKDHHVVMIHSHGCFATGQILEDAFNCTTALEECSQVNCLLTSLQAQPTIQQSSAA
jgi:L-fuculose-phosphate aldolase